MADSLKGPVLSLLRRTVELLEQNSELSEQNKRLLEQISELLARIAQLEGRANKPPTRPTRHCRPRAGRRETLRTSRARRSAAKGAK